MSRIYGWKQPSFCVLILASATFLNICAASAGQFTGLETLPDEEVLPDSRASAVSSTGGVFVGYIFKDSSADIPLGGFLELVETGQAVRWTAAGEIEGLGYLHDAITPFSFARGVSNDGNIVIGTAKDGDNKYQAFIWTRQTGMEGLGFLSDLNNAGSMANAISGLGNVIVGSSWSADFNYQAFRWTNATGMTGLGSLSGSTSTYSEAFGVNEDGAIIVGVAENADADLEAFVWTAEAGMTGLGFLSGAAANKSSAKAVSADGTTIVGVAINSNGKPEAFRWNAGTGMVGLNPSPDTGQLNSRALAVSADGSVIVGESYLDLPALLNLFPNYQHFPDIKDMLTVGQITLSVLDPNCIFENILNYNPKTPSGSSCGPIGPVTGHPIQTQAFRWTNTEGMQNIADLLTSEGIDLTGWILSQASGVSADGSIIVGTGQNPGNKNEGWWVKIGTGFISASSLSSSLASLTGVGQSAQQSASNGLGASMNANMNGGSALSAGTTSAWGGIDGSEFNVLKIDPYALSGTVGLAHQATSSTKIGFGIHFGDRRDKLPVLNGATHNQRYGIDLIAAYEPGSNGVRLYGAALADYLSDTVRRGYLNGVTPTSSRGTRSGNAIGLSLVAGWSIPVGNDGISIMPLVGYEISHFNLNAYTETTGPFPVHVDRSSGKLQIARAGTKIDGDLNEAVNLWASINFAHRFENRMPGVSGEVLALTLPFNIAGATMRQNWGEGSVGTIWHVTKEVDILMSVGATTDGDTAPFASTRLGLSIRL